MFLRLLLFCIIGSAVSNAVSKDMTEEEFQNLFPMAGTTVPEFDIVHIHPSNIQKRDVYGQRFLRLKAFDQNIDLWLKPIDGVLASAATPVWTLRQGYQLISHPNEVQKVVNRLLQDQKQAASLLMNTRNGRVGVNGYIGAKNLYIHPANNNHIQTMQKVFKRSVDSTSCENCTAHIIYKVPETQSIQSQSLEILEAPMNKSARSKRSLPNVLYPEIMVIMDYSMYAKWNFNLYQAVAYLLAFWNSVDMRYRAIENPRYRLNIAGIIIAEDPKALHFMNYFTYGHGGRDIDVYRSLENFGKFAVKLEQLIPQYRSDALITLTSDTFCTLHAQQNSCTRGVAGLAYESGACRDSAEIRSSIDGRPVYMTVKVGLVTDKTGFDGINVAAHELGHLLGAKHDGVQNRRCANSVGNLMAPAVSLKTKSTEWSDCTLNDFENYLRMEQAQCLFNKPKSSGPKELTRFLAGQLLTAQDQCERIFGKGARVYDQGQFKSSCTKLYCFLNGYITPTTVADGTTCAQGMICLHGKCVKDIRNVS